MWMHGGKRAKNTRLLASPGLYTALAGQCDGQHEHEPWRITTVGTSLHYDTATDLSTQYCFCKRMADLLAESRQLPPATMQFHHHQDFQAHLGPPRQASAALVARIFRNRRNGCRANSSRPQVPSISITGENHRDGRTNKDGPPCKPAAAGQKAQKMFRVGGPARTPRLFESSHECTSPYVATKSFANH